ncbi:hypothetical protein QFC24_006429 [Naganishia onofrii]|uniref:Uncharacterized protein n=1 Tax=Naganishia onofrii TaxID=1851511 RepID=A0ACC2X0X8_9TREE|nr:hypothetical protein QFC24_006429 [Naganishia onofrii]
MPNHSDDLLMIVDDVDLARLANEKAFLEDKDVQEAREFLTRYWNTFLQAPWEKASNWKRDHPEYKEAGEIFNKLLKERHESDDAYQPLRMLFRRLASGKGEKEERAPLLEKMHIIFGNTRGPGGTWQESTMSLHDMVKDVGIYLHSVASTDADWTPERNEDDQNTDSNKAATRLHRMKALLGKLDRQADLRSTSSKGKSTQRRTGHGDTSDDDAPATRRVRAGGDGYTETSQRTAFTAAAEVSVEEASLLSATGGLARPEQRQNETSQASQHSEAPYVTASKSDEEFLALPTIRRARGFFLGRYLEWTKERKQYRHLFKLPTVHVFFIKRIYASLKEEHEEHPEEYC